jgi:plasmid stability protein
MRTTIRIDDELYRTLKARAAQEGRTVAAVIEDAVRAGIAAVDAHEAEPLPELPTYGGSGVLPGVDLADNARLQDLMDEDEAVHALR